MDENRLSEVLAVLVEEIGAIKMAAQDNAAIQTQHSADIRNLAAEIAITLLCVMRLGTWILI
ncbi:MAG: hypothetical protein RQ750_01665 [Roseovarius sp.]|nr:hypothetical protein [Roseovarius sp.]